MEPRASILLLAVLAGCGGASEASGDPPPSEDSAIDGGAEASADSADVGAEADGGPCGCTDYTVPVSAGTIVHASIREISGLAASRTSPGVLWTHNDSGDSARLFAIDSAGAFLGELRVSGATAIDWEDLAVGPCGDASCIWVGDFGDNATSRTNDALYRIPEPTIEAKPFATRTVAADKIPFEYPDGKWNAEALLVHPTTGEIVIVTKGSSPGVYRFPTPLVAGAKVTLTRVSTPVGLDGVVTGGDVSPCGDRALLRTYSSLFEYRIGDLGAGLATPPTKVPVGKEAQGEAVAYREGGRGYFTASEGASVPLLATTCR
ncbi:MAG: hypothetical protein HYV09_31315 [Deltaproteobacteria bacterium]|nr:hypothetical protein [Deltaproteobacteria bacterium]